MKKREKENEANIVTRIHQKKQKTTKSTSNVLPLLPFFVARKPNKTVKKQEKEAQA